jgi:hypothetical protein
MRGTMAADRSGRAALHSSLGFPADRRAMRVFELQPVRRTFRPKIAKGASRVRAGYTACTGEWEVGRIYHHALSQLPSHEGGSGSTRARQQRDDLARRPIATQH